MTVIAGLLIVALIAQQFFQRRQMDDLIADFAIERASLLDRIQHPEARQVEAGEVREYEPPKDTAEMAFIGQEVPYGYQVGTED
jgi:hypothetical protein